MKITPISSDKIVAYLILFILVAVSYLIKCFSDIFEESGRVQGSGSRMLLPYFLLACNNSCLF